MKKLTSSIFLLLLTTTTANAQMQALELWWADTGQTDTTHLGSSIVALGDINFDGLNDFIVGSMENQAFIYFGSTDPDTVPDMVIPGPSDSIFSFRPIANIGDVNGDDWDDFLFWAMVSIYAPIQCRAYIYFGGDIFDETPDLILDGPVNDYYTTFGLKATGIGDFNGDGGNDFLVLDRNYLFLPESFNGRVFLYYGGTILDSIPDWEIQGGEPFNNIGADAAHLGDIDSDGFDDIVIVDNRCDGPLGEFHAGVIAIFYGAEEPDTIADFVMYGAGEDAGLGISVAGIDYDGDDQRDIVVGNGIDYPPNYTSSIHVYLVSPEMDPQPDYIIPDQGGIGYSIGHNLIGIDLNGDGWQDIISGDQHNLLDAGKVYACLGGENPDTLLDAFYFHGNIDGSLGSYICNAGDINGDEIDDLIISEYGFPGFPSPEKNGKIHVIKGDTTYHQSVGIPIQIQPQIPISQILLEAHPNPFNSQTVISFDLPAASFVALEMFDVKGRVVHVGAQHAAPLSGTWLTPGHHQFTFNGENLPSGIYLIRLKAGDTQATKKIVLLK